MLDYTKRLCKSICNVFLKFDASYFMTIAHIL
jgi:hypothetical protein